MTFSYHEVAVAPKTEGMTDPLCPLCGKPVFDDAHTQGFWTACPMTRLAIYRHAMTEMHVELLKSVESERLALRNNEGLRAENARLARVIAYVARKVEQPDQLPKVQKALHREMTRIASPYAESDSRGK